MKERSANRQLAINMVASLSTFAVGLGVRFFLTPYIVRTLGREAYGFIGLSADILSYTGLITIALNSMAGRFVTIKYTAGDVAGANKYYSSVFFSNVVLAFVTLLFATGCIFYLERMINIPPHLIFDVKFLFCFLALNNVIGLITGIWGVSTFIKNRLDLTNIRGIIGNFINATLLACLFAFFAPHVWYMGIAGLVMTIYVASTNKGFARLLTPDLKVRMRDYDWGRVVELVKSGAWNLVTKLGSILGHELDLLFANVFVGASVMGQFAMTKGVPFLILSLFGTISGVFSPNFTALYAQGRKESLVHEIHKSMRILSLFSAIPLACLYFYGKEFYGLWLPTEDAGRLQLLTVLGTFALPYTLPLESLWSIFTITNKLKYSSLFSVIDNFVVFAVVMLCMVILKNPESRLLALASTRSLCGVVRGFVFLPLYGAHCLGLKLTVFYKTIFRSLIYVSICFAFCYVMRFVFIPRTWLQLAGCGLTVAAICVSCSVALVLTRSDRKYIYEKLFRK